MVFRIGVTSRVKWRYGKAQTSIWIIPFAKRRVVRAYTGILSVSDRLVKNAAQFVTSFSDKY
jgi:hypothetical protein